MKKIYSLIATVALAMATMMGATGCAGDPNTQSTGEKLDDTSITLRVKEALHGDTLYKYPDVDVSTFKGTVELSGFVTDGKQKTHAADLAGNVTGVRAVMNKITLKP